MQRLKQSFCLKSVVLFFVLSFFAFAFLVLPIPDFDTLKKVDGVVLSRQLKKGGVGAQVIINSGEEKILFNIASLTHKENTKVRNLKKRNKGYSMV